MEKEAPMTKHKNPIPELAETTAVDSKTVQSPVSPPKRRRGKAADNSKTAAVPPGAQSAPISKRNQLIRLLSMEQGADLATLNAALGWLPHTTRAALSGLRKAGHAVITEKDEGGNPTRYRIAPTSAARPTPAPLPAPTTGEA